MIRHPITLTKICRSVATAAKPRVPDTIPFLEPSPLRTPTPKNWAAAKPRAPDNQKASETPLRTLTSKDWSAKSRAPDTISYLDEPQSSEPPPPLRTPTSKDWSAAKPRAPDTIANLDEQIHSEPPPPLRTPTSRDWSAAKPRAPDTITYLEQKASEPPPPLRTPTSKDWSAAKPRAPDTTSYLDEPKPSELPPPLQSPTLKVWSRPHPIHSSPSLVETPAGAASPETLKKWSRPEAPPNSRPSQTPVLNSDSQPSIAPLAAQVSQPIKYASQSTSLFPDSDHANQSLEDKWVPRAEPPSLRPTPKVWSRPQPINSSPTSAETPAGAAFPPELLKKWSRPVASPSNSRLSQIPVVKSDSQPSIAPLAAQVSQPIKIATQPTSLSPDSDHTSQSLKNKWIYEPPPLQTPTPKVWSRPQFINSSPTLAETPAGAASPETLKKWPRPVATRSNSKLPQISVLNPDSHPSMAPTAAQKVSQRIKKKNNASLSPDSKYANQSLEEKSPRQAPPSSSLADADPDDELANKRLRHRRNQKSYLEGRGRFERVSSKVLLQQSANTPLSRKKASQVPKLIKTRRMDVFIPSTLSVATLAKLLNVKLARLQQQMKRAGMESESSYDHILTSDYAVLLAEEFGRNPIVDDEAAFDLHPPVAHPNPSSLPSRPPIVTIMGHVDHGKTTLLDTLRSASVAKGEAGGITQHIGAFSVPVNETGSDPQSITFLDTPGHAAFSAMRARGADVTDIIVLVVAADDGIMPQTKEVINLFKRDDSQVSLVVAINKIDKPNVDLDSVKRALMTEGIQVEDFGGDIPAVHVSGLTGEGLPVLLETLSLVAEMQDLRAEHTGSVYGHVLESNVQKGIGPVATILIRRGCLKAGTHILSGLSHAKVRRMNDSNGKVVPVALPGMAVTVSGWKILPKAGDVVLDGSENDIKKALLNRARMQELEALHQDVDAINLRRQQDRDLRASTGEDEAPLAPPVSSGPRELKLVIKADVSGSAEAVRDALHGTGNDIVRAQVISTGVGEIMESDVMMAKAADATIVGFSVTASRSVQNNAAQNGVPVCTSDIIYRLVDEVRQRVTALLPVVVETKVTGEATILQLFDIDLKQRQTMKIAGCRVTNGVVEKEKFARVIRNGNIVYDGTLSTMRHIKKDITEARKGTECGLGFGDFRDLEAGDLIQMYERIEKPGVI